MFVFSLLNNYGVRKVCMVVVCYIAGDYDIYFVDADVLSMRALSFVFCQYSLFMKVVFFCR